ncbi:MAG: DUF4838 domain-containing protein [Clostridiales bacterium]|jgi:hypothetical protein|nr:DUF4838 domain-containing protein [Clostridiales bacterium]
MNKKLLTVIISALCGCLSITGCNGCGGNTDTPDGGVESNMPDYTDRVTATTSVPDAEGTVHIYNITETSDYIMRNGYTDYKIVIPVNADSRETLAAEEFKSFFKEATFVTLEIITDAAATWSAAQKYFVFGDSALRVPAGVTADYAVLDVQGFVIKTVGKSIFITGADNYGKEGTLWGAYELLYRLFDFDYYGTDTYALNTDVKDIGLYNYDITDVPDFQYRIQGNGYIRYNTNTRNRMRYANSTDYWVSGGKISQWHNSFEYLPKATYQKTHPEWYSDDGSQLCYTAHGDADSFDEMAAVCADVIKTELIGDPYHNMLSLSIQDNQKFCTCAACAAENEKYNGSNAAVVIKLLNGIADKLNVWFGAPEGEPYQKDLKLLFFAYHATNTPPVSHDAATGEYAAVDDAVLMRGADSANGKYVTVAPYFAETNGDYTTSFFDAASVNAAYASNLKGWAAISSEVYCWFYQTNFNYYLVPYNTFNAMQDTYKFIKNCGAKFLMDQGQFNNQGESAAWTTLKGYLTAKFSWNVNADGETLIKRFIKGYYGEAAEAQMTEVFNSYSVWATYQNKLLGYAGSRSVFYNAAQKSLWPRQMLIAWKNSLDAAEKALSPLKVSDPDGYNRYTQHIGTERISYDYLLLLLWSVDLTDGELAAIKTQFKNDIRLSGITRASETMTIDDLLKNMSLN